MTTLDVLTVGELNPDLIVSGFSSPTPLLGSEQIFSSQSLVLGSSSAISAVLMSRLGLRTALSSRVGNDEHGRFCLTCLAEDGVDVRGVVTDAAVPTGLTISLAYPGDRLLLTSLGTMATFSAADVPQALVAEARHLHATTFYLHPALAPGLPDLFRRAREGGLTTSLDTGHDPNDRWLTDELRALLPHVDIILPNEVELAALTGIREPETAARALLALGVGCVAAKRGAAGGMIVRPMSMVAMGSPRIKVVDTTGAGDAFNAGLLYGHLTGLDDAASLRWATACGSLTAAALGGTGGFSARAEVERFIAAWA